ncbi:undecaprenyl diphosphate synthase family protein, partial [Actinomadura livida]
MGVRRTEKPRGEKPRGARKDGVRRRPSEGGRLLSALRRTGPYAAVRDVVYRLYERRVEAELPTDVTPRHVGVILDGNRRWARTMGLADVNSGHQRGAAKISELLQWSTEAGVEVVTLWLLSTDNL